METKHSSDRAQKRAIPPFVDRLLDEFGEELYDGHGAIQLYFSRKSVRRMEQAFGRQPVTMFKRYLNAYKVESTNGATITRGWRTARMNRR
jgi:hypothetical protein